MTASARTPLLRSTTALVPPLVALGLQLALWRYLAPFAALLFYPAVLLSSWLGGLLTGIAATALSATCIWFFFLPPRFSFVLDNDIELVPLAVFALVGAGISFAFERARKARWVAASAVNAARGAVEDLEAQRKVHAAALEKRNESLQIAQELLRAATLEAKVGLVMVDREHRYVFANPAYSQILNLPHADIVGMRVAEVLPDLYQAQIRPRLELAFAGERVEYQLRRPSARGIDEDRLYAVVYQPRDGAAYVVVVIYEITDRLRAERKLSRTEDNLRMFIEHTPAAIAMLDRDMRYLVASRRWITDYRLGDDNIIGRSHYEVFPEIPERWKEVHRRALAGESTHSVEEAFPRNDGAVDWLRWEVLPWRDGEGAIGGIIIATEDITERKRAQSALADSEAKYRTLLQSMSDGVFVAQDYRFVFANPALPAMLGYSESELIGLTFEQVIAPEFLAVWNERFAQRIATGDEPLRHYELRLKRKDGNELWVELRASRVSFADRPAVLGIIRDISERRRAEEALRQAQKLEALGTLSGGIAHDFNNLLAAIVGNVRIAREDIPATSPAQEALSEAAKAGARATELVKRILAFSRPADTRRAALQLRPVVDEACKLLRSTLPAMIDIDVKWEEPLPAVEADGNQIHQVVINLVTNAAHAIGTRAGRIHVALARVMVHEERARLSPDLQVGQYVCLTVSDDGAGMDAATLERVFDPFFTTKPAGQGTGLGLSVVHGIVRSHGGAITVYSQPGQGTTFRVYVPTIERGEIAKASGAQHAKVRKAGEHVLFVDDEAALVRLGTRQLMRYGYRVTGHTDPQQALAAFLADPESFDPIVTDMSMPAMSGLELVRQIKAVRPDIPVVMTTGYLPPEDQALPPAAGVSEVILKPDNIDQLAAALERQLDAPAG